MEGDRPHPKTAYTLTAELAAIMLGAALYPQAGSRQFSFYRAAPFAMAKLSDQEAAKLKETLRGFLNNALRKYPKAGPGILRKLWNEVLEERFGPPPKRDQDAIIRQSRKN